MYMCAGDGNITANVGGVVKCDVVLGRSFSRGLPILISHIGHCIADVVPH